MAPFRGRGAFRGRGSGGRRGRGGNRGKFGASRLQGIDRERVPAAAETSESEPESDIEIATSSDEEEAQPTSSAFHSLLQTFQSNAPRQKPPRKRRRIDHETPEVVMRERSGSAAQEELQDVFNEEDSEGGEEDAAAVVDEEDEADEDEDATDSFNAHFADMEDNELSLRLKAVNEGRWAIEKWETAEAGRCLLQSPEGVAKGLSSRSRIKGTNDIKLKTRLVENAQKTLGQFKELEQSIAPAIFNYQDLLFGGRTVQNADRLRRITCLHALNHVFKTRDRVIKNNAKIAHAGDDDDGEYRDQGFTRPKVLFLLETKQACVRAIEAITELCTFEQQENKKRFLDAFSAPTDNFSPDRPADFRELFSGNDDNEFRIGLKFTRKTLKLYSKFYNSDVIFASALGLRRVIDGGDKKKKDHDFLSSIEVLIMDQTDATAMQNWEHVEHVFANLNLQPKEAHGCDFSRVRNFYLDGHAVSFRQTIVLSAYLSPKMMALWNKYMRNISGRLKYTPDYRSGVIESTTHNGIRQTFSRFDSPTHLSDPDGRFKFFTSTVLPSLSRLPKPVDGGLGIVLFIPSYLDFVRVRNHLVDTDFSYGILSEYTDATAVRRARSHFMNGKHNLLLYTGRAHHFHRYLLRGVKRVVFYGLPENPIFYQEAVEWIGKTIERGEVGKAETSVRACFSKWERLELERIVGSKRVGRMIAEKGDTFDFV